MFLWQVEADSESAMEELLRTELHQNDKLDVGYLENGLRYVLLPNRAPPNRFEAHLEVHAGGCAVQAGGFGWDGLSVISGWRPGAQHVAVMALTAGQAWQSQCPRSQQRAGG